MTDERINGREYARSQGRRLANYLGAGDNIDKAIEMMPVGIRDRARDIYEMAMKNGYGKRRALVTSVGLVSAASFILDSEEDTLDSACKLIGRNPVILDRLSPEKFYRDQKSMFREREKDGNQHHPSIYLNTLESLKGNNGKPNSWGGQSRVRFCTGQNPGPKHTHTRRFRGPR